MKNNIKNNNIHASDADVAGGFIGDKRKKVFGGYFENPANVKIFAEALSEIMGDFSKDMKILEIGAGLGIVGEAVKDFLNENKFKIDLTISDKIGAHIEANKNENIKKFVFDNKKIPFNNGVFDLVIARSVTHYERDRSEESKVLEEVNRILKNGGYFVNQAVAINIKQEAELFRDIYLLIQKPMNIQTKEETLSMLKKVFANVYISDKNIPALSVDAKSFLQRYIKADKDAKKIIKDIQNLIKKVPESERPNIKIAEGGFSWNVPYQIFICKKG